MVVEDEDWIRSAMIKMIEESMDGNYEVVAEADNGEDALDLVYDVWPTVIITDIRMPKRDGLWLVKEIKDRNLPIITIIASGYDEFEYARQAIKYDVSDFLLKPVVPEELKESLNKALDSVSMNMQMHKHLIPISLFLSSLSEKSLHQLVVDQNEILNNILMGNQISSAERTALLKIFSGRYAALIRDINPGLKYEHFHDEDLSNLKSHFYQLAESWVKSSLKYTNAEMRSIVKDANDYIQKNYFEDLKLTSIANQFHISVSHFCLLFKKYNGQSFTNYLNFIRIQISKELLIRNDLKVYEIAEMVGYKSLPNFNRVFKQLMGCSPNEYRKRLNL